MKREGLWRVGDGDNFRLFGDPWVVMTTGIHLFLELSEDNRLSYAGLG